jgi:hypothetical protein
MKKKRALSASRVPEDYSLEYGPMYTVRDLIRARGAICLNCNSDEMLRVEPDGFYVRGKKIEQDDKEAELVYNAFREFLIYHNLTRSY